MKAKQKLMRNIEVKMMLKIRMKKNKRIDSEKKGNLREREMKEGEIKDR